MIEPIKPNDGTITKGTGPTVPQPKEPKELKEVKYTSYDRLVETDIKRLPKQDKKLDIQA